MKAFFLILALSAPCLAQIPAGNYVGTATVTQSFDTPFAETRTPCRVVATIDADGSFVVLLQRGTWPASAINLCGTLDLSDPKNPLLRFDSSTVGVSLAGKRLQFGLQSVPVPIQGNSSHEVSQRVTYDLRLKATR